MDPHALYELCVQSPSTLAAFLYAVHGDAPLALREDFSGTAALSRRWIAAGIARGEQSTATAVDLDPHVLAQARQAANDAGLGDRLTLIHTDIIAPDKPTAAPHPAPDIVFVGNFSIGYIQTRSALLNYLRRSRDRLLSAHTPAPSRGIFVCDTYGGAGAFRIGSVERTHITPRGEVVKYLWRHVRADPLTAMVHNSISFRVFTGGELVHDLPDAFEYHWRLWSIAELREAMAEAGFASTEVHTRVDITPCERPEPVGGPEELGEDWIVCVVGRA